MPATEQAPSPLIIVKRPRLHVKRLRQRQRNVYITQAAQEEQQPHEPETVATASHADEPAKVTVKHKNKQLGSCVVKDIYRCTATPAPTPTHMHTHTERERERNCPNVGSSNSFWLLAATFAFGSKYLTSVCCKFI